ncbi:MAG: M20/M25/M40 family metallo-hydrolase [Spirochaetaceae bacterium]|nr:MAG: M20/M25/M40 family metallo-hydrolase [Spirochaetaceae bacterium]
MPDDLQTLRQWLRGRVAEKEFHEFLAGFLLELCRIDTIPTANIADTAGREGELLALIERTIVRYGLSGRLERKPIDERIAAHPFYTFPHYAGRADVYTGRSNLVYLRDAPASRDAGPSGIGVNAHIDTVAPYFTSQREGQRVLGRGACDDKGSCAVMVASLRLLEELEQRFGVSPASDLTFMFVIDEEMGGNGSLALAMDEQLGDRYGTMVVLECCDGQVHPGGRGAVWYRVEIPTFPDGAEGYLRSYNPVLLALEIIRSMDREGTAIRAESDHPLFSRAAVQTSPGILGSFGEHPARICASVRFILAADGAEGKVKQLDVLLQKGLQEYIRRYGDKTVVSNRCSAGGATGIPAGLERHYDLKSTSSGEIELRVYGLSGHMGALFENDNALIKAAYLLEPLFTVRTGGRGWTIRFPDEWGHSSLLLEGGQGFVPTHSMEQIKSRLGGAVQRAYRRYTRSTWRRTPFFRDTAPRVSFSKLHNEAYQCDPDSPAVADAQLAAEDAGIEVRRPAVGWEVSSDARIFAHLRPELTVFTTGPGSLALAHSDQEQITIDELSASTLMLTLFLLHYGGLSVSVP